jgi:glycogen debranching enzyme
MHQINAEKFQYYIDKILRSSTYGILYSGIVGHLAELSSAKQFESNGSPAQAWSTAFYIELINELYEEET